ncbi:ribonuclease J, partial [Candidatus Peribacteria bacterium]|nr:ribonuclease J [Candidatus Peribacteria bacterium]
RKPIIRILPLGGFEEVGRNCMVVQVDKDLFIIDMGLQFPEEDMLGVDYLIPDISFLKGKEKYIRGILFTHGHLDHIGAAQHLLPKLNYPPCFGTKLTMGFLKKRLDETKISSKASLNTIEYGKRIRLGSCDIEFFRVTHSIPDSAGIAIHTPLGSIVHTGDFKFDFTPVNEPPADFSRIAGIGEKGVLAVMADSTNANKPGRSMSEKTIGDSLNRIIRDAEGRLIISTFSSLLNRIQQIIDAAKENNRKIFISGRSMEYNIDLAQKLGYINAPRGMIRKVSPAINKMKDSEVVIITTGSQGEERAALARISLGVHRDISIKKGDTVVLSSNPIIGNARAVATMINNLHLKGANVLTNDTLDIHTTGHGYQEDILLMHRLLKPRHIIPEHGEPYMRSAHADLVKSIGYQDNSIHLLNNGEVLEFDANGNARKSKHRVLANDVIIDGLGTSKEGEGKRVLADRKQLSSGGVFVAILKAYSDSGRLVGDPDILSRGFVYGSELNEVTAEAAKVVRKTYEEERATGEKDRKAYKKAIQAALHRFFRRKLNREPVIVPIMIEV